MTTSILNPCPGEHNLQALRDFALEAPYEWRKTLDELADLMEEGVDLEQKEEQLDSVTDAAKETIDSIRTSLADLLKACAAVALKKDDLDDYEKEVRRALNDLEDALKSVEDDEKPQRPVVLA